jgi:hypothetical protein
VKDEPPQLGKSPLSVDDGDGTHGMAGCLRNPETIPLGIELAHELDDFPPYFDLEGRIKPVFLGVESSMEKGYVAGVADSVGANMDWNGAFHIKTSSRSGATVGKCIDFVNEGLDWSFLGVEVTILLIYKKYGFFKENTFVRERYPNEDQILNPKH